MTSAMFVVLLPIIVTGVTTVAVMLVVAFYRNHALTAALTSCGLVAAFLILPVSGAAAVREATALLVLDNFALYYIGLILLAAVAIVMISFGYFERRAVDPHEYYLLLLCAVVGGEVLAASNHFVSLVLGLEILSVSLYALIAYARTLKPLEAAVKYLVLAAGSAAFLFFGAALLYAEFGTMELPTIAAALNAGTPIPSAIVLAGLGLIIVGVGFKLALVPFHLWTADVYEGASAPVTAFIATVSKGAVFAVLFRYFTESGVHAHHALLFIFTLVAITSMFVGNLLALMQLNVKRMLAYSSIAHLGYLLVAFLASGPLAAPAAAVYLAAYFITTLGAFGVISALSDRDHEPENLDEYRGLFWRRPWMALTFTMMLLSLAGIPLTAGFIGKFLVIAAGEESARWAAILALVVNSAIGLFYYVRVVAVMCAGTPRSSEASTLPPALPAHWSGASALVILTGALVWIGVYPAPLLKVIQALVTLPG
ncbi:MAG: NADH-quinone oxidoreductase subunit N [Candidatus Hydrogenedentes bacterium]|nr:NADH-quinone oxidoreductase subunit N [Candidatus Hydrogenedentota bacterium]